MNLQLAFVRSLGSRFVKKKLVRKKGRTSWREKLRKARGEESLDFEELILTRIILYIHNLKIFIIPRQKIAITIFVGLTWYMLRVSFARNFRRRALRSCRNEYRFSFLFSYFLFLRFPLQRLHRDKFLTQPCSASVCSIFVLLLILFEAIIFGWYDDRDANIERRFVYLDEATIIEDILLAITAHLSILLTRDVLYC